jgi:hypothetical protein
MPAQIFRKTILLLALAALPGFAAAAGSQAGDNGRFPIGADNEGPRQAIPNAMTNDGTYYNYDGSVYYYGDSYGARHYVPWSPYYVPPTTYYAPPTTYYTPPTTYYVPAPSYYVAPGPTYYYGPTYYAPPRDRAFWDALALCDARPLTERASCRDDVVAGRY